VNGEEEPRFRTWVEANGEGTGGCSWRGSANLWRGVIRGGIQQGRGSSALKSWGIGPKRKERGAEGEKQSGRPLVLINARIAEGKNKTTTL